MSIANTEHKMFKVFEKTTKTLLIASHKKVIGNLPKTHVLRFKPNKNKIYPFSSYVFVPNMYYITHTISLQHLSTQYSLAN